MQVKHLLLANMLEIYLQFSCAQNFNIQNRTNVSFSEGNFCDFVTIFNTNVLSFSTEKEMYG